MSSPWQVPLVERNATVRSLPPSAQRPKITPSTIRVHPSREAGSCMGLKLPFMVRDLDDRFGVDSRPLTSPFLGCVDKVSDPQPDRRDENEAEEAIGGFVVSRG